MVLPETPPLLRLTSLVELSGLIPSGLDVGGHRDVPEEQQAALPGLEELLPASSGLPSPGLALLSVRNPILCCGASCHAPLKNLDFV